MQGAQERGLTPFAVDPFFRPFFHFESMDKRFEELTRRLDRFMFWSLGLTVSVGALVVAVIKVWA